jgi:hypothetical protein
VPIDGLAKSIPILNYTIVRFRSTQITRDIRTIALSSMKFCVGSGCGGTSDGAGIDAVAFV